MEAQTEVPFHDIAAAVFDAIEGTSQVGDEMSEPMRARLVTTLGTIQDLIELNHAVLTLISLARDFAERGDPQLADGLIAVAATAAPRIERATDPAAVVERTTPRGQGFAAFMGEDPRRPAPNAPTPKNAVSVGALAASRRVRLK